ncbi:hypothetical protein B296_00008846 [Ensete ventricosum]|uniref:Uncharacterized protein n=1 Tax=Ensete ventricosum TaxID=4639 RepID=A0A427AS68_ENSVE|nr:hypothetical protein B296_00008846 [Ensete ventricosum]
MASDYLRPPGRKKGGDHTPPAQAGRSTMTEKGGGGIEGGGGGERWKAAIVNLSEMGTNVESLQKILVKKAVFADEETFAKASLTSEQARTIKIIWVGFALDSDSCIFLSVEVFKLHMEELRFQKEEISKKQSEIKVLEATVLTLSRNDTSAED